MQEAAGLEYNKETKVARGQVNGYYVAVVNSFEGQQNIWHVIFSVNDTSTIDWSAVKKGHKRINDIEVSDHKVHVIVKPLWKPYKDLADACNYVTQTFAQYSLKDACASCGSESEIGVLSNKGYIPTLLCDACIATGTNELDNADSAGKTVGKMLGKQLVKGILDNI